MPDGSCLIRWQCRHSRGWLDLPRSRHQGERSSRDLESGLFLWRPQAIQVALRRIPIVRADLRQAGSTPP